MGYRDAWHANYGLTSVAAQEAYVSFAEGLGFPLPGESPATGGGSNCASSDANGSSGCNSGGGSSGGSSSGGLMGPVQSTLGELDGGLDTAGVSRTMRRQSIISSLVLHESSVDVSRAHYFILLHLGT